MTYLNNPPTLQTRLIITLSNREIVRSARQILDRPQKHRFSITFTTGQSVIANFPKCFAALIAWYASLAVSIE